MELIKTLYTTDVYIQTKNSPFQQIFSTIVQLRVCVQPDCLLGLYWTGLTVLDGFSFLVIFLSFYSWIVR